MPDEEEVEGGDGEEYEGVSNEAVCEFGPF